MNARPYDINAMSNAARRFEMEVDTRDDFMLVRHCKTGGKWRVVRTVAEIEAFFA